MNPFRNLSIKNKLIAIILGVSTVSTALAFTVNILRDIETFKADLMHTTTLTAQLVGENCKFALVFKDNQGAADVLKTLDAIPTIVQAYLYDKKERTFAAYLKEGAPEYTPPAKIENGFHPDGLHITQVITHEDDRLGAIYFHVSTEALERKILKNIFNLLLIFLGLLVIAYLIAIRLQRIISVPIHELTEFTGRITREADYSLRIEQHGSDEIGTLKQSINIMVTELEKTITSLTSEIQVRKLAEAEANRLRATLRNIIDSMPSILIAVDTQGRIMQWNYEAYHFTGISPTEAHMQFVTDIFPLLKNYQSAILKTIKESKPNKIPSLIQKNTDEKTLYMDVTIYPLTEHGNEGAVIRVDDVTEKTRMESIMIQTEKMMSIGGLAAGMAHEINNPLGIILQAAQNMKRRTAADFPKNIEAAQLCGVDLEKMAHYMKERKITEYIDGIISSVSRAADIVANMLQFSRQSIQSKTPSDMNQLVDRTVELAANDYDLKKKFDFRHIEIVRDYDETLTDVPCIVTEIEQVVLNLLKNAAQAMAEKIVRTEPPRIWLRTLREASMARIEIEDNGPGIKDDVRTRIFEPFFTTKEVGTGTGLGLSVSYFIITKNHKGTIEMETEYGKGTKFVIRLPLDYRLLS